MTEKMKQKIQESFRCDPATFGQLLDTLLTYNNETYFKSLDIEPYKPQIYSELVGKMTDIHHHDNLSAITTDRVSQEDLNNLNKKLKKEK